jgi:hypothetical protein
LKENDLAVMLHNTREYLDVHGKQIGMGALIALAVMAAITFVVRSRAAAVEDVWRRRSQLNFESLDSGRKSLETLQGITRELSDPSFVMGALMDQGREALRLAQMAPLPPDPELNRKARTAFEELLARFGDNPLAVGSALSGLATVEENEFVLDNDLAHKAKASEYLDRIVGDARLNGMPFQKIALDRIKSLDAIFSKVITQATPPLPPPPPAEPPAAVDVPAEGSKTEPVEEP